MDAAQNEDGLMVRDNVYGQINDDARRRDFTINALYYTTDGFKLLDFCNALSDLKTHQIRMIGDPQNDTGKTRFECSEPSDFRQSWVLKFPMKPQLLSNRSLNC